MSPHLQGRKISKESNQHEAGSYLNAWLTLRLWRWWRYIPPKRRLTFNVIHGVISQKKELFTKPTCSALDTMSQNNRIINRPIALLSHPGRYPTRQDTARAFKRRPITRKKSSVENMSLVLSLFNSLKPGVREKRMWEKESIGRCYLLSKLPLRGERVVIICEPSDSEISSTKRKGQREREREERVERVVQDTSFWGRWGNVRATVQAVSRLATAAARVRSEVTSHGMYAGQSGISPSNLISQESG
jgi:hypothetical protein